MKIPAALASVCLLLFPVFSGAAAERKPDIIVILSDDMGWSDIGCYGGEIATPHLDTLAGEGVRFTQFYNTGRCCPTRASLLTGLYPHQAGVGHMMNDQGYPGYRGELSAQAVTIAEALRPAGYGTCMCGKWHVTTDVRPDGNKANWPVQRGFDRFYGTITGAGSFYDPATLCRQNTLITPENDAEYQPQTYYYTDALADNASAFIREHCGKTPEKPFFLYLAFTAAHWPMHALPEDIAKYKGKFDNGYGPVRAARLERLIQMGLVMPETPLSRQAEDWDRVENKEWEIRCMEVYAAMIDRMDAALGRVLDQLKAQGRYDNTMLCFLQDNGGCAEGLGRRAESGAPREFAPLGRDGLQPRIVPVQTRDGRPVRSGPEVMPGPADTYIAYGRGWANVSNTPFREYKHWVHEGGISTPLILHWPAGMAAARRNTLESFPAHLIDIMATCVEAGGAAWPAEKNGQPVREREGVSLLPVLTGQTPQRPGPIFWEHEGNRAVRDGQWKLVAKEDQPWELYDMEVDRTESHDLSAVQPDRVRTMSAQWMAWAARADVLPEGAWKLRKSAEEKPAKAKASTN